MKASEIYGQNHLRDKCVHNFAQGQVYCHPLVCGRDNRKALKSRDLIGRWSTAGLYSEKAVCLRVLCCALGRTPEHTPPACHSFALTH